MKPSEQRPGFRFGRRERKSLSEDLAAWQPEGRTAHPATGLEVLNLEAPMMRKEEVRLHVSKNEGGLP